MFARAWVAGFAIAAAGLVGAGPAGAEPSTLVAYADDTGTRDLGSGFDSGVGKPRKMVLKVKVEPNVRIELEYQVSCRGNGEKDVINEERETRSRRIRLPLLVEKPRSCLVYAFASFDGPSEREVHFRIELRAKSRGHRPPPPDPVPRGEIRAKLSVDPLVIGSSREATVRAIGRDAGKFLTGVDLRIDRPDEEGGWEPAYLAFASSDGDPSPPYALPLEEPIGIPLVGYDPRGPRRISLEGVQPGPYRLRMDLSPVGRDRGFPDNVRLYREFDVAP